MHSVRCHLQLLLQRPQVRQLNRLQRTHGVLQLPQRIDNCASDGLDLRDSDRVGAVLQRRAQGVQHDDDAPGAR